LRPQHDLARAAAALQNLGYHGAAPLLANPLVVLVELRGQLGHNLLPFGLQHIELFLVLRSGFPRGRLLRIHLPLFFRKRSLRRLHVLFERLGLAHLVERAMLALADFLLAKLNLILESPILFVGLCFEHLVSQFRNLLLLDLDILFQAFAFLLIGRERGTVGLQAPDMPVQRLFNQSNVLGEGGDFALQSTNLEIQRLQLADQLQICGHWYFNFSIVRRSRVPACYPASLIELTAQNAAPYLARDCTVTALGGGVSNTVLLAESRGERVVVKQSLGKLRVEQDWFSERSRIFREAAALRMLAVLLPEGSIPTVLSEDRANYAFVMTAAPAAARTWKSLLFDGVLREETAERVARILGAMIARTWKSSEFESVFGDQTVFDQLRIDPYYRTTALRHPDLASYFHRLIDLSCRRRVSLVHGDWSPKNFLVDGGNVMAIDFEVIHFGDPSFDAAFLLNHLLLKSYRLTQWRGRFQSLALRFWETLLGALPGDSSWFEQATIAHLGCLLLARIDGKSPAEYINGDALKETIRQRARDLIAQPPSTIREVFSC
jgi:hypothetical protein